MKVLASEEFLEGRVNALRRDGTILGQVGLVLGLRMASGSTHKDLVLEFVPTPLQEDVFTSTATKASKKSGGARSSTASFDSVSVKLDTDWALEHASQVEAMLPGGVEVLGYYLYCSEKTFKNTRTSMQVTACLRNLERSFKCKAPPILIHLDATSRKMGAKSLSGGDSLKTLELQFTKVENNLVRVQSVFSLSTLPQVVLGGGASKTGLVKELSRWREKEAARVERMALRLKTEKGPARFVDSATTVPVIEVVKGLKERDALDESSKVGLRNLRFDIFCPFEHRAGADLKHVCGRMQSSGSINCLGYAYARDSTSSVLEALKMDLVRSIKSRIEVYVDEALESEQQARGEEDAVLHPLVEARRDGSQGLGTPIAICLPPRKLFVKDSERSGSGTVDFELVFSHYATSDPDQGGEEATAESVAHLEDLLVMKGFVPFRATSSERVEDEDDMRVPVWDPMVGTPASVATKSGKGNGTAVVSGGASGGGGVAAKAARESGQLNPIQLAGALCILILGILMYLLR